VKDAVENIHLEPSRRRHAQHLCPQDFDVIVMASSSGGISALKLILPQLPADLPVPIVIVQHLCESSQYQSILDEMLGC
jgi:chemotaxis response regulator CheB